jgi:antitoxin MazE
MRPTPAESNADRQEELKRRVCAEFFQQPADISQVIDFIGRPGGTRTPNQTVMSAETKRGAPENQGFFSGFRPHVLVLPPRTWGENGGLSMRVAKWGNSLAIRLSASLVEALELREGDEIEIKIVGRRAFEVARAPDRQGVLARLRAFRGRLPSGFRFDRDEANAR